MSLMKSAVVFGLFVVSIVASKAEEDKPSLTSLSSSSSDIRQQNKRLAIYGSSNALDSGFKPITAGYPSVSNYVGNPQLYTSAASNIYSKMPFNSYSIAPSDTRFNGYRAAPPAYQQYQPLAFAASHPAHFSFMQPPTNQYAYSSIAHGPQQVFAQQIPFNHFAYNPIQPVNPVLHAAPVSSFANSYQTPANTFYANPQQLHKVPFYHQQPQAFNAGSYHQAANHYQHVKQQPSAPSQIITSKPVALASPIGPASSSSHVEHSHGAVSYAHISQPGERASSASPLIATHPPQQVYYHHQPQPIYNAGDYSKQIQYAAVPIASNYYPTQGGSVHYGSVPYAHISKIPLAPPSSAATPVHTNPQKVAFH